MSGIDVDGGRPAVQWVTELPREWLTAGERLVLLILALDSFDGVACAPGTANLAGWTGMHGSSCRDILARLAAPTDRRPALLRREDTAGRHRARLVLLQPAGMAGGLPDSERAGVAGGSTGGERAGDTGGLPAAQRAGQRAGERAGVAGAQRAGERAGEHAGVAGTSLTLTPEPPFPDPGVGTVVDGLMSRCPDLRESRPFADAVTACIRSGWTVRELLDRFASLGPSQGGGSHVNLARILATERPPGVVAAEGHDFEAARLAAPDCHHGQPHGQFDGAGKHGPDWVFCAYCRAERAALVSA